MREEARGVHRRAVPGEALHASRSGSPPPSPALDVMGKSVLQDRTIANVQERQMPDGTTRFVAPASTKAQSSGPSPLPRRHEGGVGGAQGGRQGARGGGFRGDGEEGDGGRRAAFGGGEPTGEDDSGQRREALGIHRPAQADPLSQGPRQGPPLGPGQGKRQPAHAGGPRRAGVRPAPGPRASSPRMR